MGQRKQQLSWNCEHSFVTLRAGEISEKANEVDTNYTPPTAHYDER